ncbi:MAG: TRAP transporter small permease [Alphaproteobacteria bacterium]|nr:TRAP transporter small permease [Alphaproteobacteria bacterium]
MPGFIRAVTKLSNFCGWLAACMVVAVMLVLCQLVIQHYGMGEFTTWQSEVATYFMIAIAFVGAPYVMQTRGHIRVAVLPASLTPKARHLLSLAAALFSLAFCLVLAWDGLDLWREAYGEHWTSDMAWGISLWIPYLSLPFGLAVLSLQYLANVVSLAQGMEAPFPAQAEETGEDAP